MSESWSFETKQVHAGATSDPTTGARATPIYQTTSYAFRDTEHAADLFGLAELGNIYTRIMNPTQDVLEQRVAALEGGLAAVAFASGQAAETLAILNIAEAGDHIVSSASLYGGTYNLFHYTFPKLGIEVTFVDDPDDAEEWRAAIRPNTKLLLRRDDRQPARQRARRRAVADVAHEAGVPLIVDNTVPTPYLLRPIEHGADIVVHSATKFLGGHGTAIGGIVVDGGTFAWGEHADRFPGLTAPDPSYHGLNYSEALGAAVLHHQAARAAAARHRPGDLAAERVPAHPGHRDAVAAHRAARAERAGRRGVAGGPRRGGEGLLRGAAVQPVVRAASRSTCPAGAGAVVAFDLQGGVEAGKRFVDALELFSHLANIGDVRSLVIHPASTTHSQLSGEEQLATGVTPGLVRLSVGLEGIEDIKADLEAGFRAAKAAG